MYEGITVVPFRAGRITVKISFPVAKKIEVENCIILFLAIWSFPIGKIGIQTGCNKP